MIGRPLWAAHWLLALALAVVARPALAATPAGQPPREPIPLLAYYYIWFDPGSWQRAKSDLPLLGPYSSDDEAVMRQHVEWAKQVGLTGFVVSWKDDERLNARLEQLIQIAEAESFQLAIIYQGLDFEREPLPVERIIADLATFRSAYADSVAFTLFDQPLVIWSGTWEFSPQEIEQVARAHRDGLLLLASARQVDSYQAIAEHFDGNAYYWSSVDPETFPGYLQKLTDMGSAVHAHGGLWIAPAAPGFDARLIEGTRVVERRDGQTLIEEMNVAYASSPDAIGLISWNEFSENSHIEPSRNHGMTSLEILAEMHGTEPPEVIEFSSDQPAAISLEPNVGRLVSLGFLGALILASLLIIVRRGLAGR